MNFRSLVWYDQRMIFGAFLYDAAILVGGESLIDYPRRRVRGVGINGKRDGVRG